MGLVKAYLYVEGSKLFREVNFIANEVWAIHMGDTFRARRLHFGSGAADAVAVYVAKSILDETGGTLPEHHRKTIAEQLKALERRGST